MSKYDQIKQQIYTKKLLFNQGLTQKATESLFENIFVAIDAGEIDDEQATNLMEEVERK